MDILHKGPILKVPIHKRRHHIGTESSFFVYLAHVPNGEHRGSTVISRRAWIQVSESKNLPRAGTLLGSITHGPVHRVLTGEWIRGQRDRVLHPGKTEEVLTLDTELLESS